MSRASVRQEADVLIVDDHAPMREAIRACIERAFPGLLVVEASDGASALRCVEAQCPTLVLMDINLPDANGLDLTRSILKQWPCAFVAAISMDTGGGLSDRVRATGAMAFIGKDQLFQTLLPLVGAAVTLTNWMKGQEPHSLITVESVLNLRGHAKHFLGTDVQPVGQI